MEAVTYREPTVEDIGKIVEVSDYPDGHPNCNWKAVTLLDVRTGLIIGVKDGRFQALNEIRVGKHPPILMTEYFWRYARIEADE